MCLPPTQLGFFSGEESWDYHRCMQDEGLLIERRFKEKQKEMSKLTANDLVEDTGSAAASASSYAQAGRLKLAANKLEEKLKKRDAGEGNKDSGTKRAKSSKVAKEGGGGSKKNVHAGASKQSKDADGAGEAAANARRKRARTKGGIEEYCVFAVAYRNALIHD